MQRRLFIAATLVVLAVLGMTFVSTKAQDSEERLAHSNGQGVLRVGDEKFKINTVIVKLMSERKAEITLVSDITVFVSATWSSTQSPQEFDLEITGGASPGGLDGRGKAVLSTDGKGVQRLYLKGVSRTTKRTVEANFEAK